MDISSLLDFNVRSHLHKRNLAHTRDNLESPILVELSVRE